MKQPQAFELLKAKNEAENRYLGIKGKDLEIIKLDTYEGTIMIKGVIDAFSYFDTSKSKKENSMIARLFK